MQNYIKTKLAMITVLSVIAVNIMSVNALWLSVSTTSYNDPTDTISVSVSWKDFTSDNVSTWILRSSAWTTIASWNSVEVLEANGSFDITSNSMNWLTADTYSISFTTVSGDISSAILPVWNANQVVVNARVAPTLSFNLSSNNINFGTLNNDWSTYTDWSITATTSSNAQWGAVVTFDSTWLADSTINKSIWNIIRGGTTATSDVSDAYKFSINSVVTWWSSNVALSWNSVYSTLIPVANASSVIHLWAVAWPLTEAWNYSDTITFTVTWTF